MTKQLLACGALLLVTVGVAPAADACGGFFCSNVPVDQSGEHLLFGIEDDGTVIAHIQIQYEGAAESFAWVLPLPAEPEVGVGSDEIFRTLRQLTDPTFRLHRNRHGDCGQSGIILGGEGEGEGEGEGDRDVTVLQQGPVGPYERAVIQATEADALLTWLDDNHYQVPELSLAEIESYVNGDFVFLALRLLKDRSIGDLVPVVLRFEELAPCIPLRLTAIAATPDLPIYAWVLAEGRAVSTNFLDVEPNWAAIDWLDGGSNYEDVVRRAVDEATGHSFVTEFAGASQVLRGAFWYEGKYDVDALRGLDDPLAFVDELLYQQFQGSSALLALLREFIPKPDELADVSDQDFYNCLRCYDEALVGLAFDPDGFTDAVQETIVRPLIDAQAMAGRHPYLTRLHTTISPQEMTEDPVFRFNLDLGDVSREHLAQADVFCENDEPEEEAAVRITVDGREMFVEPGDPRPSDLEDMPASSRATQMGEAGPGDTLYDNRTEIGAAIDEHFGGPYRAAGGGCHVAGPRSAGSWMVLLALVGLALRREMRS